MTKTLWKISIIGLILMFAACGGDDDTDKNNGGADAAADDGSVNNGDATGNEQGGKGGGGRGGSGGITATGGRATGGSGGTSQAGAGGSAGTTTGAGGSTAVHCGANNVACTLTGGDKGICKDDACTACSGTTGNASCSAAYGAGHVCVSGNCILGECAVTADCPAGLICGIAVPNRCGSCRVSVDCDTASAYVSGYICLQSGTDAGKCVQGDCETSSECTNGVCGVATPYHCGECTADSQCGSTKPICHTAATDASGTKGNCIAATCTNENNACTANGADYCCGGACVAGNCCSEAQCPTVTGGAAVYQCVNHTCTQCQAVTDHNYYVDPKDGSDTIGSGLTSAGCRLKTIKKALQLIGTATVATKVIVLKTDTAVGVGETFPITVPHNVTISGSGGKPLINVPADTVGFEMNATASGLESLDIDGQAAAATAGTPNGIWVTTGSSATTTISQVEVRRFASDGIRVDGTGVLTIKAGVSSHDNGATGATANGLLVNGTGAAGTEARAIIDVTTGDPVAFNKNTADGIRIAALGAITINGTPTPGSVSAGTVTTNENGTGGISLEQSGTAPLPINTITGLVSWKNGTSGIRVIEASNLTLRNSVSLANAFMGVYVNSSASNFDTTKVNLGTSGTTPSWGGNTLQSSTAADQNVSAGICFYIASGQATGDSPLSLNAAGNIFAGTKNCSATTTPATTLTTSTSCLINLSPVDVAIQAGTITNTINVSNCQY